VLDVASERVVSIQEIFEEECRLLGALSWSVGDFWDECEHTSTEALKGALGLLRTPDDPEKPSDPLLVEAGIRGIEEELKRRGETP
jgi:hypothetical protein